MDLHKWIKTFTVLCILTACASLGMWGYAKGYDYVVLQNSRFKKISTDFENNKGESPFDPEMPGAVEIIIPRSSDVDEIAKILYDNDLIKSQLFFKILSKFNGFNGGYQAGTHYLSKSMSYDEIMFILTRVPKPVTITFTEGMTYRQVKQLLIDSGVKIDEERLDELVQRPNLFTEYRFIQDIKISPDREWPLQGYLWPDTYRLDPNADEESIIRMFLDNTELKLAEADYYSRVAASGFNSLDEVITLASIIQQEGNVAEMSKIGKVFLNRMREGMPLESCASINYLRSELDEPPRLWASYADLNRFSDNPYNIYKFSGLPPGPINSPGTIAIEGILWPASAANWEGADSYLYFCATGEGDNEFSMTLEEHNAKVEKYSSKWSEIEGEER